MKTVSEIIKMPEYKSHVWNAAMCSFANYPEDGPSLYHDSFVNADIIYHLKNSRNLNISKDELRISEIKSYLSTMQNASDDIYTAFTNIYNRYTKLIESFGVDESLKVDPLKAYKVSSYDEMWENTEFKNQFDSDRDALIAQLKPIQDIIRTL